MSISPPEDDCDQQIHLQRREITRGPVFPGNAVAPRRDRCETSHARRARVPLGAAAARSLGASVATTDAGAARRYPAGRLVRVRDRPAIRRAVARPGGDETLVSCPGDPITNGSVRERDRRMSGCLRFGPDPDCVSHHVLSKNCKLCLGSPQFFLRIKTGCWRIHLRFPYDSIRCTILLQVLLATLRGCSRTPHDCCCCGITGSKRLAESLG